MIERQLSGVDVTSIGSDTTIGQHTLLRHELNQKELDVYMLNTRLTWHEKILNERDAMITRKSDEIDDLKQKNQRHLHRIHTIETELHQEKSKTQTLTSQKSQLKSIHEDQKLRFKEDREQNRKLQKRIGELQDTTRSQLLNKSISHSEDAIKEIERNLSKEMKVMMSQLSKSFETQKSSILQELRTQNHSVDRSDKMQKEVSHLNAQIQEQKQTIQKMTWKLEQYTDKYQKTKAENQRLQSLHDTSMSQILANHQDLISTMKKQNEHLDTSLSQRNRPAENAPVNQPLVLALGKMEQFLETMQGTSLTKSDLQQLLREISNVQSSVGVTPKLLKDMMDSLRETRMELDSKLAARNPSEAAVVTLQSSVERVQDQVRHLEQILTQKFDRNAGELLGKIENFRPESSFSEDRRASTEFLDAKITSEMQRLNQTVEKSLKHSVDKLYDTLKQSFDVLAKNMHEMACGDSALLTRGSSSEVEDLLHRVSSSVENIAKNLSKQEFSQKSDGKHSNDFSELYENLTSAMNLQEVITNQDILLTHMNDIRDQVSLYAKNTDDGFSFFHQQIASKKDLAELVSHFLTSEQASELQQISTQQMQEHLDAVRRDLKSAVEQIPAQENHFDPLRRGSVELSPEGKIERNSAMTDPILQSMQELKTHILKIPTETEQSLKTLIETHLQTRAVEPKKIIEYFDQKMKELRLLIDSRVDPPKPHDSDDDRRQEKSDANLNKSIDSDCGDSQEIVESKRESITNVIREFRVVMDEMNSFITAGRESLPELQRLSESILDTIYNHLNTNKSLNTFNEVQNLHSKLETHLIPLFKFFIQSNSPQTFEHSLLQWSSEIIQTYQEQIPEPIVAEDQIQTISKSVEKAVMSMKVKDARGEDMKLPEMMHQDICNFHQDVVAFQKEVNDVQNLNISSIADRFMSAVSETKKDLSWQKWAFAVCLVLTVTLPAFFVRNSIKFRYDTN